MTSRLNSKNKTFIEDIPKEMNSNKINKIDLLKQCKDKDTTNTIPNMTKPDYSKMTDREVRQYHTNLRLQRELKKKVMLDKLNPYSKYEGMLLKLGETLGEEQFSPVIDYINDPTEKRTKHKDYFNRFEKDINSYTNITKCKWCLKTDTIVNDYTQCNSVCSYCGAVGDKIEDTCDYVENQNQAINPLLPKSCLSTEMSGGNATLKRLHKWSQMGNEEKSLWNEYKKIDILLMNEFSFTETIRNKIKLLFKILTEKNTEITGFLTRGTVRKSLIGAIVYNTVLTTDNPLTKQQISKICDISSKELTVGLKKFKELENKQKVVVNTENNDNIILFINKISKQLNIPSVYIKIIEMTYERCLKLKINLKGKESSIVSGLIYFIVKYYNLNIEKKQIVNRVGITEVSLNKVFNILKEYNKYITFGYSKIII
jgi:transcription initiation factor TFIIIB Brf1 subunit/transcription initiation factor TFIIB